MIESIIRGNVNRLDNHQAHLENHQAYLNNLKVFYQTVTDQASLETLPDDADIDPLTWEDSYAIALALRRDYPQVNLEQVSLGMIYRWTLALPEFADDPQLANEEILSSIYQEWFEEVISL